MSLVLAIQEAESLAVRLLAAAGLQRELADAVAQVLVAADTLGHRTHGLALLGPYLQQIEAGHMARSGVPKLLNDEPTSFRWDAGRLPGAHVLPRAIAELVRRAADWPVVTASIADCFHVGALQVYLEAATAHGLICLMAVTDPTVRSVAPFGGIDPVLTSNPIACGIPTRGDPILIDICTSTTSNAGAASCARRRAPLPGPWLLDNAGHASDDPAVLMADPRGTLLPLGGMELGYKGFALGLMVEALALALSGFTRSTADHPFGEGAFIQLINPAGFAGRDLFLDEMQRLVDQCHASRPLPGGEPVRMPGKRALQRRRQIHRDGLDVPAEVIDGLAPWFEKYAVSPPRP